MSVKTQLHYSLKNLRARDRQGSFASRYDRHKLMQQFIRQLLTLGYTIFSVYHLRQKHVTAVVSSWKKQKLSPATMKNRLSVIRRLAGLINKPAIVPSNQALNIAQRNSVCTKNKALYNPDFTHITDKQIRISLELQRVFGLRREESLKIKPHMADQGRELTLLSSWCKRGRSRSIPILTKEQRHWLEKAKDAAGKFGQSLIPLHKNYIQQRYLYDKQVKRAGLKNPHGLRHAYAQRRYKALTGWDAPVNGGLNSKQLTLDQKKSDHRARMILTQELGHSREQITVNYLGR